MRTPPHFKGCVDDVTWPLPGYRRGHLLLMLRDGQWRWGDTMRFVPRQDQPGGDRPCVLCHRDPTPEGYDPCIGEVSGALFACCGHGVQRPYIKYLDKIVRADAPRDEPWRWFEHTGDR